MNDPKLCISCRHPVGNHSHLIPHACKADKCDCTGFYRSADSGTNP